MIILSKRVLLGSEGIGKLDLCDHCVFGKKKRVSLSIIEHRTKDILDYIYPDLWGPSGVSSFGRKQYMLAFMDDFSRKVWVYLKMKHSLCLGNSRPLLRTRLGGKSKSLGPIMD